MKRTLTLKRVLAFAIAVICSFTVLATGQSGTKSEISIASAESTEMKKNKEDISDTQSKLTELEKKQSELDQKISSTKDDISKEQENQNAIEEQIKTVQQTILTLNNSIVELNKKIGDLAISIGEKSKQVENKKKEIESGVADFKKRIRTMYISGSSSYSDILIGAKDFYDMLMKIELVKRVAEHDDNMIDNLVRLKSQYESEQASLEADKKELEKNKTELEKQKQTQQKQKEKLDGLFEQSKAAMKKLSEDKAAYEKNKSAIDKESEETEAALQKLYKQQEAIKKKEAEEAARKKAAEEAARKKAEEEARRKALIAQQNNNSGSGTDSNGNSTSTNAGGNTTGQTSTDNKDYNYTDKSQFTWPVPGFYHISYGMGYRWGAYHKGIDIWSPGIRGANICAAASGTVILVSNTCTHDYAKNYSCGCGGGYGNYCIIDHGNGYWTLYGHSQHISVVQGQHVNKGDVLGIIGSTGHSTGDHLHFEIRLNGSPVDPTLYV